MSEVVSDSSHEEEMHWNGVGKAFLSYLSMLEFSLKERERRIDSIQQLYQFPTITFDKFKIIRDLAQNNQDFFDDMVDWYSLTCSLTHSLTHSLTQPLTYSLTGITIAIICITLITTRQQI